jgi:pimeloyl-ACP methyl ester esterase
MPWYENDTGDSLWYEERGRGPAIVFIHGWCMSSSIWKLQLESLSSSYRVIAPDLRGHGRSAQSGHGYHFEGFAADMVALFRHLDLKDTILAGWSLGAQVAIQAFAQLSGRLAGLVLIDGTPRFIASEEFPYGLSKIEGEGMGLKLRRNADRALEGFMNLMFAPGELDDKAMNGPVRELLSTIKTPAIDVALKSLNSLIEVDMRHLLPAIDLPALVINGARDVICLPEASSFMAEHISDCRHIVMQGCGHAPFLTRQKAFETALVDFSRSLYEHV